jgi:DNA-binding response OmpR family regulator
VSKQKIVFIGVEDPSLQFSLAVIFERKGYQVISQPQSKLAGPWVLDERVDLLVLDNSGNWDDPWDQKLFKIRCQFANQPILILSTRLPNLSTFNCEDAGLYKIIQTPADPALILEYASELLN